MNASEPLAIILAAGRGTRMKSDLPKVLFPVLGRPMIHYVIDAVQSAGFAKVIVVVGYKEELVRAELAGRSGIEFVTQTEQRGTGHAVQICSERLANQSGPVLIVAGDSPLIQRDSIRELLEYFQAESVACLLGSLNHHDPTGLGRIVRNVDGNFEAIVEHADATPEQREISEVNMSTYLFDPESLLWSLGKLDSNNAQGELYLTDCPGLLLNDGKRVDAKPVLRACEALSINTIDQLGQVENRMQELGYPCAN